MNTPDTDEKTDYFEAVATKLEDLDCYLEFLEAKLEEPRQKRVTQSGMRPAMRAQAPAEEPAEKPASVAKKTG